MFLEGYDEDYYYEDDDDSNDDVNDDVDNGGTYEPGVMTDADWIMREGRLGTVHSEFSCLYVFIL